ncbi:F3I6.9 PROTEIN [Salix koriyanagi]|uniref:F3I6.9 PROTEIN n=1 Tax=Salix koriyanagi TaxID=2511006 RepID=A0A9Q0WM10_9ROSI|nr:F3I6.9 PROTEIN [Salix koriyanagi]
MKKLNGSFLPRNRNLAGGNKKVTSKSLHLSLTMDPPDSEPAPLTTTRKSFIMEKMGDKDIVKRTFKTFQNNFSQLRSSAEERAIGEKQVPAKGTDVKVSTSITPRKGEFIEVLLTFQLHDGNDPSPSFNHSYHRSHKSSQVDRRTAKLVPSSSVLRSDERPKRTKELSKKLEEKSNAKPAERTNLRTKSKEENGEEIKKLRQSSNFKPMPGFYRAQKASKSPIDKHVILYIGIAARETGYHLIMLSRIDGRLIARQKTVKMHFLGVLSRKFTQHEVRYYLRWA